MSAKGQETSIVRLRAKTKEMLDMLRHPGQSYDGILEEIINFWNEQHSTSMVQQLIQQEQESATALHEIEGEKSSWWWSPDRNGKTKQRIAQGGDGRKKEKKK